MGLRIQRPAPKKGGDFGGTLAASAFNSALPEAVSVGANGRITLVWGKNTPLDTHGAGGPDRGTTAKGPFRRSQLSLPCAGPAATGAGEISGAALSGQTRPQKRNGAVAAGRIQKGKVKIEFTMPVGTPLRGPGSKPCTKGPNPPVPWSRGFAFRGTVRPKKLGGSVWTIFQAGTRRTHSWFPGEKRGPAGSPNRWRSMGGPCWEFSGSPNRGSRPALAWDG